MRYIVSLIAIATLVLSSVSGCGSNQETPSTPISNKELGMTGKERQEQNAQQYQQKSDQEFDAAQAQAEKAEGQAEQAPPPNPQ